MNRRDLIKSGLVASATLALPGRAAAQFQRRTARDRDARRLIATGDEPRLSRAGSAGCGSARTSSGFADFGLRAVRHAAVPFRSISSMAAWKAFCREPGHGRRRSDPESRRRWLKWFSNLLTGHTAPARATYMTRSWYTGKYGLLRSEVGRSRLDQFQRFASRDRDASGELRNHPSTSLDWGKLGLLERVFCHGPGTV